MTVRILLICSTEKNRNDEIRLMQQTLTDNGYPIALTKRGIKQGSMTVKKIKDENDDSRPVDNKENIFLTLSYYGNESAEFARKLKRICKKYLPQKQLNIVFKKTLTSRNIFLPLQKGADPERKEKNIVYQIKCNECKKPYIRETSRTKQTRIKEHKNDIRKSSERSNIAKHANELNRSFDFNNVKAPAHETNWTR